MKSDLNLKVVKTGGAGSDSFAPQQSLEMPDIFEVGTPNSHGIYALQQGIKFINNVGLTKIMDSEKELITYFYQELSKIPGIKIYGDFSEQNRVPVIAFNYQMISSADFAQELAENYEIATRAQSHCAPLLHTFFATEKQGMVRFSFSYFNTMAEIEQCLQAIKEITNKYDAQIERKEKE